MRYLHRVYLRVEYTRLAEAFFAACTASFFAGCSNLICGFDHSRQRGPWCAGSCPYYRYASSHGHHVARTRHVSLTATRPLTRTPRRCSSRRGKRPYHRYWSTARRCKLPRRPKPLQSTQYGSSSLARLYLPRSTVHDRQGPAAEEIVDVLEMR